MVVHSEAVVVKMLAASGVMLQEVVFVKWPSL